jgi:hypothetical protein
MIEKEMKTTQNTRRITKQNSVDILETNKEANHPFSIVSSSSLSCLQSLINQAYNINIVMVD